MKVGSQPTWLPSKHPSNHDNNDNPNNHYSNHHDYPSNILAMKTLHFYTTIQQLICACLLTRVVLCCNADMFHDTRVIGKESLHLTPSSQHILYVLSCVAVMYNE